MSELIQATGIRGRVGQLLVNGMYLKLPEEGSHQEEDKNWRSLKTSKDKLGNISALNIRDGAHAPLVNMVLRFGWRWCTGDDQLNIVMLNPNIGPGCPVTQLVDASYDTLIYS